MPWAPDDAPKHCKAAKTAKQKRGWSEAANSARARALEDGKSEAEADAIGVKVGNSAVANVKEEHTVHSRLQEFTLGSATPICVDAEKGILHDVLFLGQSSTNKADYSSEVMQKAVSQYEGAPSFTGHSKDGSNPDPDRAFGVPRNCRVATDGIRGDYHFPPKHRLAEDLVWRAQNAPRSVGFSHDADCTYELRNGRKRVTKIDRVYSVDYVTRPATTRGLFEDEEEEILPDDPKIHRLAETCLSAADNVRSILFAKDEAAEAKTERIREALSRWQSEVRESEIADEIRQDEYHKRLRKINDTAHDLICRAMWDDEQYPTIPAKKARCLAVLADWETTLTALTAPAAGDSITEEETQMAIEYKDITVDALTKERPDLVAVLQGTDEHTRLTDEIKTLTAATATKDAELATLKAEKAALIKEEEIAADLKAANFPVSDAVAYTAVFKESLSAATDKAARDALIKDRMGLVSRLQEHGIRHPSPMTEVLPDSKAAEPTDRSYDGVFGVKA